MISIPGYTIDEKIGTGGMAEVYLGHQISIDRPVAIKIMSPKLAVDESFAKRFIKEANVGALTHPNIITVYDAGRVDSYYYIVMEYIGGGDLAEKISAQQLTFEQKIEIVKQIATALGYSYSKGFIHRDVKPENILFREDGTPVLADFGIAKAVTSATNITSVGTIIGSPYYMSPEQTRGQEVDHRSDLYSLGVVLYELLTGTKPFDSDDNYAIGYKHVNELPPPLPPQLARYQPVLEKVLAKDPNQRYQNSAEFIAAIDAVFGNFSAANSAIGDNGQATVIQPAFNAQSSDDRYYPQAESQSAGARVYNRRKTDRHEASDSNGSKLMPLFAIIFTLLVIGGGAGLYLYSPWSPVDSEVQDKSSAQTTQLSPEAESDSQDSGASGLATKTNSENLADSTIQDSSTTQLASTKQGDDDSLKQQLLEKERLEQIRIEQEKAEQQRRQQQAQQRQRNEEQRRRDEEQRQKNEEQRRLAQQKIEQQKLKQKQKEQEKQAKLAKIKGLLSKGKSRTIQEKLLSPKKDSAYYYYKQALKLDANNSSAKSGIENIADLLEIELNQAFGNEKYSYVEDKAIKLSKYPEFKEFAQQYLAKAKQMKAQHKPLNPNEIQDKLVGGGKGPVLVKIPTGGFIMGDTQGTDTEGDEKPIHDVTIGKSIAIGKYEITFDQYEIFARTTGRTIPADNGYGRGLRPVINVTWHDATAYAEWLSAQTGRKYRLPTEAEWEYAARANTQTDYFWGNSIGRKNANCYGCSGGFDNKKTAKVGSYQANAYGIHDMHGNVWEWVQDCWHDRYDNAPSDGSAWEVAQCGGRVLRGGSWKTYPLFVRSSNRDWYESNRSSNQFGFRVVRED